MTSLERLAQVKAELQDQFIERDELVVGVLAAVLSKQHLLMLGPPGTAKSMLAKEVCRRIGGSAYFEWLLTKFTTPEEIFGPVSLPALEAGRYERITSGKLPEAEIAFLDEIFKANSAILNALLTILNERRFHQGSEVRPVPLESILAASNELPEEDELGALYDRFLLRFTVGYIEHDHRFARLLKLPDSAQPSVSDSAQPGADTNPGASAASAPASAPATPASADPGSRSHGIAVLSPGDLDQLQAQVQAVPVPDQVITDIITIRRELGREGVIASDRRYRQALGVLRAAALIDGRDQVESRDLVWLEHILWSDPEQKSQVAAVIAKVTTGHAEEANRLRAQAEEILAYAHRAWPSLDARNRAIIEADTKLHHIQARLEAMLEEVKQRGRDPLRVGEILVQVVTLRERLIAVKN